MRKNRNEPSDFMPHSSELDRNKSIKFLYTPIKKKNRKENTPASIKY